MMTCYQCGGGGKITCARCEGKGSTWIFIGGKMRWYPCVDCDRSGQVKCNLCNGTGQLNDEDIDRGVPQPPPQFSQ
jgi:hypothetical protein